jgi:hypothetical protein
MLGALQDVVVDGVRAAAKAVALGLLQQLVDLTYRED